MNQPRLPQPLSDAAATATGAQACTRRAGRSTANQLKNSDDEQARRADAPRPTPPRAGGSRRRPLARDAARRRSACCAAASRSSSARRRPGTGVIAPATSATSSKSTSPCRPSVRAVDPDVDDRRARLDPVGLDHPVAPDGGDEHVGACAQTAGRSAVRECAIVTVALAASSSWAIGLPKRLERPMTTACAPLSSTPVSASSTMHAGRRARPQPLAPEREVAGAQRRQPVDVLARVDQAGEVDAVEVVGHRQLAEDAADVVVGVELLDQRLDLLGASRRRAAVVEGRDPDLARGLALVGDVDRAGRILADEDRSPAPAGGRCAR